MIPKIIHYCWFGGNPLPELAVKCIGSWRTFLPDYEIKCWDESSFDISINTYTKQAYAAKKYAFVTDYVRLYALYTEGGVYMDTDVEMLRSIDRFLVYPAFSGFENETQIPTGIMASQKGGEWVKFLIEYYQDRTFILSDGSYDCTTNVFIISKLMETKGLRFNNTEQNVGDMVYIFPKDYFCPKSCETGEIVLTDNTYCIHHFSGSWISKGAKIRELIKKKLHLPNLYVLSTVNRLFRSILGRWFMNS